MASVSFRAAYDDAVSRIAHDLPLVVAFAATV